MSWIELKENTVNHTPTGPTGTPAADDGTVQAALQRLASTPMHLRAEDHPDDGVDGYGSPGLAPVAGMTWPPATLAQSLAALRDAGVVVDLAHAGGDARPIVLCQDEAQHYLTRHDSHGHQDADADEDLDDDSGDGALGDAPDGEDVYRVRVTRTWWRGWRAELDYLGAHASHGDVPLRAYTAGNRYGPVNRALNLAADLHADNAPHTQLVVWIGQDRHTPDDLWPTDPTGRR